MLVELFQETGFALLTLLCLIVVGVIRVYDHFFNKGNARRKDYEIQNKWIEEEDP
jgi:hypothetical protein